MTIDFRAAHDEHAATYPANECTCVSSTAAVCPLLPGDIIFTGTPPGVGSARDPKRFIPANALNEASVLGGFTFDGTWSRDYDDFYITQIGSYQQYTDHTGCFHQWGNLSRRRLPARAQIWR